MPKRQFIDPEKIRKPRTLSIDPIPINAYDKSIEDEKDNYSKVDFLRIFRDMVIIREFETMLNLIKTTLVQNQIIPFTISTRSNI